MDVSGGFDRIFGRSAVDIGTSHAALDIQSSIIGHRKKQKLGSGESTLWQLEFGDPTKSVSHALLKDCKRTTKEDISGNKDVAHETTCPPFTHVSTSRNLGSGPGTGRKLPKYLPSIEIMYRETMSSFSPPLAQHNGPVTSETTLQSSISSQTALRNNLPSFSIPSTATELFASLPSSGISTEICTATGERRSLSTPGLGYGLVSSICSTKPSNVAATKSLQTPSSPSSSPVHPPLHTLSPSSTCSSNSGISSFGRRDWCRESLTPRFNHLRAVLEGRCEDPPTLTSHDERSNTRFSTRSKPRGNVRLLFLCFLRNSLQPIG